MNIVQQINQFRVEEKDKLLVQFFDKKRQITNEDLETIDVLDEKGNPIYDLFIEIYNKDDPYSLVCKNVAKSKYSYINKAGVKKHISYTEVYKKAFAIYEKRRNNENIEVNEKDLEIAKLKKELEKLQKSNKKSSKESKEIIVDNKENKSGLE